MNQFAETFLNTLRRERSRRITLVTGLVLGLAAFWWAFGVRLQQLEMVRDKRQEVFRLQNQIQEASQDLAKTKEAVEAFEAIHRDDDFSSDAAARLELEKMLSDPTQSSMFIVPEWKDAEGNTQPTPGRTAKGLDLLISVPGPLEARKAAFADLGRLLQRIAENQKMLEIRSMKVTGEGDGISEGKIKVNYWLRNPL